MCICTGVNAAEYSPDCTDAVYPNQYVWKLSRWADETFIDSEINREELRSVAVVEWSALPKMHNPSVSFHSQVQIVHMYKCW
jgi:hypothetical protein